MSCLWCSIGDAHSSTYASHCLMQLLLSKERAFVKHQPLLLPPSLNLSSGCVSLNTSCRGTRRAVADLPLCWGRMLPAAGLERHAKSLLQRLQNSLFFFAEQRLQNICLVFAGKLEVLFKSALNLWNIFGVQQDVMWSSRSLRWVGGSSLPPGPGAACRPGQRLQRGREMSCLLLLNLAFWGVNRMLD